MCAQCWLVFLLLASGAGAHATPSPHQPGAPQPGTPEQTWQTSQDWAKHARSHAEHQPGYRLNVNDYCKDAACRAQVAHPPQATLDDAAIGAQKAAALATDPTAQAITTGFSHGRPHVQDDLAMQTALFGQQHAYEISHGVSDAYVDCKTGRQCQDHPVAKVCHTPTHAPVPVEKVPTFTPQTTPVHYTCPAGWSVTGRQCRRTHTECRYDRNNVRRAGEHCMSYGWRWDGVWHWGDPPAPYRTGKLIKRGRTHCGTKHDYHYAYYQICGPVTDTRMATPHCAAGWTLAGDHCVKNQLTWATHGALIDACHPVSERCLEPGGTRIVNGVPTALPCWRYEVIHQCDLPDGCAALSQCKETQRACSLAQRGVCVEQEVHTTCQEKRCRQTHMQCGAESFCLDGDCYAPAPTRSQTFNPAAARLAALSKAAQGLGDPPHIFTGRPMACSKKPIGMADCCADGGWATKAGLAQCDDEEKALGRAKENGLAIFVGEYCAEKVLKVCLRKKRSYCVYTSKLGKILQRQGAIGQLGKTLGPAEHPTCAALTPEELARIRFDYIDFSDFYQDLQPGAHLPPPREIQQRLQSAVGGPR